jgi:hypothetical protein
MATGAGISLTVHWFVSCKHISTGSISFWCVMLKYAMVFDGGCRD